MGIFRPEGWENPYEPDGYKTDEYLDHGSRDKSTFEAGADAMLEGLLSQKHQDWLATCEGEALAGRWVFIPTD